MTYSANQWTVVPRWYLEWYPQIRQESVSKLTKRKLDALAPADREYVVPDGELPGFACRVHPSGHKTFVFKYRLGGGRGGSQRKMTLGRYGEGFTTEQARARAKDIAAQVHRGEDPGRQRIEHRRAETLETFAKRYISDHATPRKRPSSATHDQWLLDRHVVPKLGSQKIVDITTGDVAKFIQGLSDRPILANRCRSLLSKMFSLSVSWGVRRDQINPVRLVAKFPEQSRERFLSGDEIKRLGDVLRDAESNATEPWQAIAAIRLLLLTGCRRGEVMSLKWEFIDRDNEVLLLPESKTGRKTVYLTAPVLEILEQIPRKDGCPYVLPSRFDVDDHFRGVAHVWERLRLVAGLHHVRIHDLRHTFASKGVGLSIGLPLIGGLLGHAKATTTAKYAHLAADPTRKAGARIARQLLAELGTSANVIPFGRPKARARRPDEASGLPHGEKAKPAVRTVRRVRNAQTAAEISDIPSVRPASGASGGGGS